MTGPTQLETCVGELTTAVKTLTNYSPDIAGGRYHEPEKVLACIPLHGSVLIKDVSDLAGVPEPQLSRVIRMTATAGFLTEPEAGLVAHTSLSAPFVTQPFHLDAAMFLAGVIAPTSLQMAAATERFGGSARPSESAYSLTFNAAGGFADACEQQPRLQRQWLAFLRYATGDVRDVVTDVLTCLAPLQGSRAHVVEVGAKTPDRALTLAKLYPTLQFTVQLPFPLAKHDDSHPRISLQSRTPGSPQPIHDAAVYILNLPSPSPIHTPCSLGALITAELHAHLDVLRSSSRSATLVLTPRLLPESKGSTAGSGIGHGEEAKEEGLAHLRDMCLLQLVNGREMDMAGFMSLLNGVSDRTGRLVLVNKVRSGIGGWIALEVKYQAYTDR
ncbi:hypothetical protein BJX96DRAFT_171259 [Aspergillus floccosus]